MAEFGDAATRVGLEGWPCQLRSEALPAPHQKPVLPHGEGAVYVFAISAAYGRSAPCGPGTVLKVGRVGPNNKRRFRHSHYLPTARTISTLAQSLLAHPILWPWLGIQDLNAAISRTGCSPISIASISLCPATVRAFVLPSRSTFVPESAVSSRAPRLEARMSYSSHIQQRHRLRAAPPDPETPAGARALASIIAGIYRWPAVLSPRATAKSRVSGLFACPEFHPSAGVTSVTWHL